MLVATEVLAEVLTEAMAAGADFAEIFVEDVQASGISMDEGRIESLASSRDRGAGIRVIHDGRTGFAHTSDISLEGLRSTAQAARESARGAAAERAPRWHVAEGFRSVHHHVSPVLQRPEMVPTEHKVALLVQADDAARGVSEVITQVSVSYGDTRRRILVANTEGTLSSDDQTRIRFSVNSVASGDSGLQTGFDSMGHTAGFEIFDRNDVRDLAVGAAQRAVTKLSAIPAPSGPHVVVIGPGSGGVLFHEACGHGLEADLVAKGASVFANKIGEQVASPLVTIVDDGTMGEEWGYVAIDDEGRPSERNVLIENGVLVNYLRDRKHREDTPELPGSSPSAGNGRRQSYRHLPMVRMTNTYLAPGDRDPADIIAEVPYGVYVARLGGGQVDTGSGDFVFGMTEAYLIEDGQLTSPLREGQLIGNGPKVLQMIDAVGNDFEMGGPGTCGKDGQGVPVGDGVPTLRVTEMTIGGTAGAGA